MKQILWQLINSVEVSEVKHYTQLIKTGIPSCMKGTSFEVLMRWDLQCSSWTEFWKKKALLVFFTLTPSPICFFQENCWGKQDYLSISVNPLSPKNDQHQFSPDISIDNQENRLRELIKWSAEWKCEKQILISTGSSRKCMEISRKNHMVLGISVTNITLL